MWAVFGSFYVKPLNVQEHEDEEHYINTALFYVLHWGESSQTINMSSYFFFGVFKSWRSR